MRPPKFPHGQCMSCDTALLQANGFAGTDLCGPCCTGEAATLESTTHECSTCKTCHEKDGNEPLPVCCGMTVPA